MVRLIIVVGAAVFLANAALAADIPAYEPPAEVLPAVTPVYDWSGVYLGLQGGWKFGEDDYEVTGADTSFDVDGPMVGGHLGANMAWGNFILGLEGDGEWADVTGDFAAGNGDEVGTSIDWQASIRGRVGLRWSRVLLYGTGGAAFAGTENRIFDAGTATEETEDDTRIGWTAGAGLDAGITNNLSAGIEYRYTDLGEEDYLSAFFPADTFGSDLSYHAIRGRLSWRFSDLAGM